MKVICRHKITKRYDPPRCAIVIQTDGCVKSSLAKGDYVNEYNDCITVREGESIFIEAFLKDFDFPEDPGEYDLYLCVTSKGRVILFTNEVKLIDE